MHADLSNYMHTYPRFPSNPLMIRVPFFLILGFNKETPQIKGQKGSTGEPSISVWNFRTEGTEHWATGPVCT